jgi:hypothetical protein
MVPLEERQDLESCLEDRSVLLHVVALIIAMRSRSFDHLCILYTTPFVIVILESLSSNYV